MTSKALDAQIHQVIGDPDTSAAARAYLSDALKRDPEDVAKEAEALSKMLIARCDTYHKHQEVDRLVEGLVSLIPNKDHRIWKILAVVMTLTFIVIFLQQFNL